MAESDGQVIERLTRENMMLRALVNQLELKVGDLELKAGDLERRIESEGEELRLYRGRFGRLMAYGRGDEEKA